MIKIDYQDYRMFMVQMWYRVQFNDRSEYSNHKIDFQHRCDLYRIKILSKIKKRASFDKGMKPDLDSFFSAKCSDKVNTGTFVMQM